MNDISPQIVTWSLSDVLVRQWSVIARMGTLRLARIMDISKKRARKFKKHSQIRLHQWLKGERVTHDLQGDDA